MLDPSPAELHAHLIEANRSEYGEAYPGLTFLAPGIAQTALLRRSDLLAALSGLDVTSGCGGTKLDMNGLSPGCRLCVEGDWSCLFINGRCNARCFYCPTEQSDIGLPTTNAVSFRTPGDYVAYLETFGLRGMSLSGGEPLLTPRRSLAFLAAAKQHFGDRLHTWLYTNGTRIDHDILLRLRDAGLDEIRFDIGATRYNLKKLRLAVGLIPTVTVEIPAVPEEGELLRQKLLEMADCGVDHLNLHQLRLTPHSLRHFVGRPYTYLHGEKVTVLESELTALELLLFARQERIPLPINYCSFVYKHRYQQSAARRRSAVFLRQPHEEPTSAGYLRTLALAGPTDALEKVARQLASDAGLEPLWLPHRAGRRLAVSAAQCARLPWSTLDGLTLVVTYAEGTIRQTPSCRFPFREVRLPSERKLVVERRDAETFELHDSERDAFVRSFLSHGTGHDVVTATVCQDARPYECIVEGMQEYF